jgi:hypothetical protein
MVREHFRCSNDRLGIAEIVDGNLVMESCGTLDWGTHLPHQRGSRDITDSLFGLVLLQYPSQKYYCIKWVATYLLGVWLILISTTVAATY